MVKRLTLNVLAASISLLLAGQATAGNVSFGGGMHSYHSAPTASVAPVKIQQEKHVKTADAEPEIVMKNLIQDDLKLEKPGSELSNIRLLTIKQAAYTIGVQTGTNERYQNIKSELDSLAAELDVIYNFSPVMISKELIPPIIHQAENTMRFIDDKQAKSSVTSYNIAANARIGLKPNWRDYLYKQWPEAKKINPELQPKTAEEAKLFREQYLIGWKQGSQQADDLFSNLMNSLTADLKGMNLYHSLVSSNIITQPVLATGHQEVVLDGKRMSVGSTIYRITTETEYQSIDKWTPIITTPTNR